MKRKNFSNMQCPVARGLEHVGEWWNILLLRDAFYGLRRFDQFQQSLDIAPNTLTRRLNSLVDSGLLERRRYSDHPPRYEYVPTAKAEDFRPVLSLLLAWGNKHFAPEGPSVLIVDRATGERAEPIVVDRISGRPLGARDFRWIAGPAANERMRKRYSVPDGADRAPERPARRTRQRAEKRRSS